MLPRSHDHSDIEAGSIPAENSQANCTSPAWYILYLLPLINTANESSQVALALRNESTAFLYTAVTTQAITSFATDAAQTVKTFRETCAKATSQNYRPITGKMYAAGIIAGGTALYVATTDSVEAWFFGASIPDEFRFKIPYWTPIIATLAAAEGITALMGQSIYCYKYIIAKLNGTKRVHANKLSSSISPIISTTSGVIDGIDSMLSAAVGTAAVLKIKPPGFYVLAASTLFNGFAKYVTTSDYMNEVVDGTITTLTNRRPYALEVANLAFALAVASYLAYASHALAADLLEDATEIMGVQLPEAAIVGFNAFTYVTAVNSAANNTACVFELTKKMAIGLNHLLFKAYDGVAACVRSCRGYQPLPIDNDNDYLVQDNRNAPMPVANDDDYVSAYSSSPASGEGYASDSESGSSSVPDPGTATVATTFGIFPRLQATPIRVEVDLTYDADDERSLSASR